MEEMARVTVGNRILVVDDEKSERMTIAYSLRNAGFEVFEAVSAEEGLGLALEKMPALIISDIRLKGMSGIDFLSKIKEISSSIMVILITAYGTIEDAVYTINLGADNYLTKPVNLNELEFIVRKAIEKTELLQEAQYLRGQLHQARKFDKLVGSDPKMTQVFNIIEQVAPSSANVLIYGESGTGKELVGEALHKLSDRASGPFIRVNCAVFSDTLLESELFGHEKGAFTGAFNRRAGRFEMADGGTLYLDDINMMPEVTQIKLMRFLQEREFERVGGQNTIKVNVRIVASTNTPLEDEVKKGNFREEIYYRLNVIPINLPSLRERKSDVPLLIKHFMKKYAVSNNKEVDDIDDEALALALSYDWPGNVRELENVIERAVVLTREKTIRSTNLISLTPDAGVRPYDERNKNVSMVGRSLADIEEDAITATLESFNGSTRKASEVLGISQRKIQYKLRQYEEKRKSEQEKQELNLPKVSA